MSKRSPKGPFPEVVRRRGAAAKLPPVPVPADQSVVGGPGIEARLRAAGYCLTGVDVDADGAVTGVTFTDMGGKQHGYVNLAGVSKITAAQNPLGALLGAAFVEAALALREPRRSKRTVTLGQHAVAATGKAMQDALAPPAVARQDAGNSPADLDGSASFPSGCWIIGHVPCAICKGCKRSRCESPAPCVCRRAQP
jgi:hypothetical protein